MNRPRFRDYMAGNSFINENFEVENLKICVCMSYTENIKEYSQIAEKINSIYVKRHGYDLRIFSEKMTDRAIQWCKIKVINILLNENKYDYIFWIDSDAYFNNHRIKLEDIIKTTDKNIIICEDNVNSGRKYTVNSGTIFVKCNDWSKKFLDLLWNYKGKYLYDYFHEQTMIENFIKENIMNCQNHIEIKASRTFNSEINIQLNEKSLDNNFIIHLMSKDKKFRIDYMNKWLQRNKNIFENYKTIFDQKKLNINTPVFYINLDDNNDRKKNITNLLNNLGFNNVTRFSAVNTKNWENLNRYKDYIHKDSYSYLVETYKIKQKRHHYDLTLGAVGCYISFYKIFQEIIDKNIPIAFICEDDLILDCKKADFWKIISNINIPKDCDLLLINSYYYIDPIKNGLNNITFFLCTTFMIVTLEGAKNMIKNLIPIQCQVDTALSRLSYDKKIKIYGLSEPNLKLKRDDFKSNIQNIGCYKCDLNSEVNEYKNK